MSEGDPHGQTGAAEAAAARRRIPLGIDDFRTLRERGLEYVDKSQLIRELIDREGVQVVLLPRPRRFGKTLNLSMLRCFFERRAEDLSPLFEGLHIWEAGERYRAHFQRYPVIHMTFKGVKFETFDACWEGIRKKIELAYREHRELLDGGHLGEAEARDFQAILDGSAPMIVYVRALMDLSAYLHRRHGQEVVLLLDEYDEPIHAGYLHGYADRILDFFRNFLTEGLKGNPHLYKAVLTGILRVARESIFSGLNNLAVYSLLRSEFSESFGFTEAEVEQLLSRAGRAEHRALVRAWYNGYVFGGRVVHNPWSILSFAASEDGLLRGYWLATSANDLVRDLLQHHAIGIEAEMETLLDGGSIERRLDEYVALGELRENEDALWSLLVFSGYLRAEPGAGPPGEEPPYRLSIPNREVREIYTSTFQRWMEARLQGGGGSLKQLTAALLRGDAEAFEAELQAFVTAVLSVHDLGHAGRIAPERVYQAFLVGLLATLEPAYQVRSNRESGRGRPDVVIRPTRAGSPGVVLELKVARRSRKTLDQALEEGLAQIRSRDYAAELRADGATPVHAMAVAFDGKAVRVRSADG